jgi:hypothetical protein
MFAFLAIINFRVDFISGRYICVRKKSTFERLKISVLIREFLRNLIFIKKILDEINSEINYSQEGKHISASLTFQNIYPLPECMLSIGVCLRKNSWKIDQEV